MDRENLKLVVLGHVDHGKSTLIGRLLYDTASLPPQKIGELRRICGKLGSDVEFAFLLDQFEEERLQRITIDTTQVCFRTKLRDYVIIDAPGHKQFLKNMITGASQADAAVLLVDVSQGLGEQSYRHVHMLSILGIRKLLVGINKMDLAKFNQEPFDTLLLEVLSCLQRFDLRPLAVVPISARKGDNVANRSLNMPWYSGPTFLAALDRIALPALEKNLPLRLPVQDVYRIDGHSVAVGRMVSGTIYLGQKVVILPRGQNARIRSVQTFPKHKTRATAGESVGITFSDGAICQRGQIICTTESQPTVSNIIAANVFWMDPQPLKYGQNLTLKLATQEVSCQVVRIANRTDSATFELLDVQANELADTQVARVTLRMPVSVCADSFSFIKEMGRLVLVRRGNSVAGGIVP